MPLLALIVSVSIMMTITRAACGPIRWQLGSHDAVAVCDWSVCWHGAMQIVAGISVTLQLLWSSTTGCPELLATGNTATTTFHQSTILRKSCYLGIFIERIFANLYWHLNKLSPLAKMFVFVCLKLMGGSMWTSVPKSFKQRSLKTVVAAFCVFH